MVTRSMPITEPRPVRRPRIWDWRLVASAALILASTAGILNLLNRADDTRSVLVAAHDLPAGAVIGPDDLAEAHVGVDARLYQAAIPGSEATLIVGKTLDAPAYANQVLVRAQVTTGSRLRADQVAMTVGVKPEIAAGGHLRAGDEVMVLVTTDKGKPTANTRIVLDRVQVYAVGYDERVLGLGAGQPTDERDSGPLASVTLVLTPDQATALATAKWTGDIDVLLLAAQDSPAR